MNDFLAWLSPILAAIAICAGQAVVKLGQDSLVRKMDEGERKRDEARSEAEAKRAEEAKWREEMERRMDDFEKMLESMSKKIDSTLKGQLTDMRTDIVHKAHRYIDDLGCASTDEKNAFDAQYKMYSQLCDENGIKNDFISTLYSQVMALPGRCVDASQ